MECGICPTCSQPLRSLNTFSSPNPAECWAAAVLCSAARPSLFPSVPPYRSRICSHRGLATRQTNAWAELSQQHHNKKINQKDL